MELVQFNNFKAEYSDNILSNTSLLKGDVVINSSGDGLLEITDLYSYSKNANSLYFSSTYNIITGIGAYFDLGTALEKVIPKAGNHILQFSVLNDTAYGDPLPIDLTLEVWVDGLLTNEYTQSFDAMTLANQTFYNFTQSFEVVEGQNVNYKFRIDSPYPGNPAPVLKLYFSGFKLEVDDRKLNTPSIFTEPSLLLSLWQSRVDNVNTQTLTLATDNLYSYTGVSESNDTITLITTAGLIQPTKVGNVITIDTAFSLTTPAGADHYLDIKLVVNGFTYRGKTVTLIKGAGNTDFISASWTLPVGSDFFTYGGEIYLRPDATCNITNRYISIVEQSNP